MSDEKLDRYWLAGLLEGERTFLAGSPSQPGTPAIVLAMTDRDVVERAAGLFDRAVSTVRRARGSTHKTVYTAKVRGAAAGEWMRALRPLMGLRRQEQIDRALSGLVGGRIRWMKPVARCSAAECPRPGATRGLCKLHYHLWWKSRRRGRTSRYTPVDAPLPKHTTKPPVSSGLDDPRWLGWLAGLLEGEGCFTSIIGDRASYPRILLSMCDLDVVETAARLIGGVSLRIRPDRHGQERGWSTTYTFSISGRRAAELMHRLHPLMGERRRSRIARVLEAYAPIRLTDPPSTCTVADCRRKHRSRGLCHTHYMSWSRDRAKGRTPRVTPLR